MTIICGDCLEVMKSYPDNHFSSVVTDPPYGLSFMGKGWDHAVPGKEYWKECLRVTKPGGFILAMGGTRTYHRLTCAIEDAGWEIRDCIMWVYGSGFPKGKGCLKPAYEPIILARKKGPIPLLNIDACRVNCVSRPLRSSENGKRIGTIYEGGFGGSKAIGETSKGRWPANIIFDEEAGDMLDKQSGILKSGQRIGYLSGESINEVYGKRASKNINPFNASSGGASRFFYCAKASSRERNEGLEGMPDIECKTGCGGAMPIDDDGKERDRFKKIAKNSHPTVKPLALMRYLITLISPPENALILDPFCGSGSTILAAKQLGIEAVGIDREKSYAEIARKRIESYKDPMAEPDLFEECL